MKKLLSLLMVLGMECHAQNPKFQTVTIIGSGSSQSTVLSSTNSGTLLVNGVPSGSDPRITGSGTISLPSGVTISGSALAGVTTDGTNTIVIAVNPAAGIVSVPGLTQAGGPANWNWVFIGDSRWNSAANLHSVYYIPKNPLVGIYVDAVPSLMQDSSICSTGWVSNYSYGGLVL